jgi:hypothetical protein
MEATGSRGEKAMSARNDTDGKKPFDHDVPWSRFAGRISRRVFVESAVIAGAGLATMSASAETPKAQLRRHSAEDEVDGKSGGEAPTRAQQTNQRSEAQTDESKHG